MAIHSLITAKDSAPRRMAWVRRWVRTEPDSEPMKARILAGSILDNGTLPRAGRILPSTW